MPSSVKEIAVIIPCFNGAEFIDRCLDSAWNQTLSPSEIIVVDDGSTDTSIDHIQAWRQRHPTAPVRLIRQPNKGVSAARNTGCETASSEWLAFLDIDDVWHSDHNEILAALTNSHSDTVLAFCDAQRIDHETGNMPTFFTNAGILEMLQGRAENTCLHGDRIHTRLVTGSFIPTSCTLVRRSAFSAVGGFDQDIRFGEDRQLWLKLFNVGRVVVSACLGAEKYYHDSNATHERNRINELSGKIQLYDKFKQERKLYSFTSEQLCLLEDYKKNDLYRIRYSASKLGVRAMLQHQSFLRDSGTSYSLKDWVRGIFTSLINRFKGASRSL